MLLTIDIKKLFLKQRLDSLAATADLRPMLLLD
jgi:hypothetical protein